MEKYSTLKVVGKGSFGKALLCERRKDRRKCIIKEISIKKMSRREAKQTEQEASILARLNHPNIVTFWETFVTPSALYIVMDFADGGDLADFIKKRNRKLLSENQVLHLFVQISLAIKHVHDRKILHRDLKTQNIFLTSAGIVKLGDFGIARVLHNTGELASTRIGTPYYMSPEVMDNKRYNNKTDIWSLGCILYELMALKVPFDGQSMRQLVYNIMYGQPSSVSAVFSSELRHLITEMLMKDPRKRPGITSILSKHVVRQRISTILNPAEVKDEFSHTVLHGLDILKSKAVANPSAVAKATPAPVSSAAAGDAGAYKVMPPAPPVSYQLQKNNYSKPQGHQGGQAVRHHAAPPAPNIAPVKPSHPRPLPVHQVHNPPAPKPAPSNVKPAIGALAEIPPYRPAQGAHQAVPSRAPAAVLHHQDKPAPKPQQVRKPSPPRSANGGPARVRSEYQNIRAGGGIQELIEKQKEQQRQLQVQLERLQQQCDYGNRNRVAKKPVPAAHNAIQGGYREAAKKPSPGEHLRVHQLKAEQRRLQMERQQAQQKQLLKDKAAAQKKAAENKAKAKAQNYARPWAQNMKRGEGLVDRERAVQKAYEQNVLHQDNPKPKAGALPIPPGAVKAKAARNLADRPAWVDPCPPRVDADSNPDSDSTPMSDDDPKRAPVAAQDLESALPPPPSYFAKYDEVPAEKPREVAKALSPPPAVAGKIDAVVGGVNDKLFQLQNQLQDLKLSPMGVGAAGVMPPPPPSAAAEKADVAADPRNDRVIQPIKGPMDMQSYHQQQRVRHAERQQQAKQAPSAGAVSSSDRNKEPPSVPADKPVKSKASHSPVPKLPKEEKNKPKEPVQSAEERAEKARQKRERERRELRSLIQARREEAKQRMLEVEQEDTDEPEIESEAVTVGAEEEDVGEELLQTQMMKTEKLRKQVVAAVLANAGMDSVTEAEGDEISEDEFVTAAVDLTPEMVDDAESTDESPDGADMESEATDGDTATGDSEADERISTDEAAAEYEKMLHDMHRVLDEAEKGTADSGVEESDEYFEERTESEPSEGEDSSGGEDSESNGYEYEDIGDTIRAECGIVDAAGAVESSESGPESDVSDDSSPDLSPIASPPVPDYLLKTTSGAQLGTMMGGTLVKQRLEDARRATELKQKLLKLYTEEQISQTCGLLCSIDENLNTLGAEEDDEALLTAMEEILGIEGLTHLDDFLFIALHTQQ